MIREGTMTPVLGQVYAAHRLPTAQVLDQDSSGSDMCMFMKLFSDLQQLSQHIDDVIPQPAHNSQSSASSVERAMGASHGATGWTCKAPGRAADLVRLWSARRSRHREIVGAVQSRWGPFCKKGLSQADLKL